MPVTPIGDRRRITALHWLGWSPPTLAAATGLPQRVFRWSRYEIERGCCQDVLDRVGAAYDLLWDMARPIWTAADRALADASARHARKVGWAPPLAYDDDEIDQPEGGPVPGWKRPNSLTRQVGGLIEDIAFLRDTGYRDATPAQLADRLGRTPEAIGRAISRHRRAQRLAAMTQPAENDLEATA